MKFIELALLMSVSALLGTLYSLGYLDRILGQDLTFWFFCIILAIVILVEGFALTGFDADDHFWSWLTTGLGMLGTVLGFSIALAGIEVDALSDPATLSAEIGSFLKTVSFAIDTTMIGLSAAMVMEAMNKVREMLYGNNTAQEEQLPENREGRAVPRQREDSMSIAFQDILMLLALLMFTLVVLLIPLIEVKQETTRTEIEKAAGDMIAEISWPADSPADIDLWTSAPGKEKIGYSMPYGQIFNLVRDDLGRDVDFSGLNYEFVFSRGIPDGRYRFSIVYYSDNGLGNVPVDVRVSIRYRQERLMIPVYEGVLTLDRLGQEKGVISFVMKDKKLVEESKSFAPFEIFYGTMNQPGSAIQMGK